MIKLPKFANDDEEATWWYDNRELVSQEFQQAATEGRLGRGTVARMAGLTPQIVRLSRIDADKARLIAGKRGLDYRDYLDRLIHEAIEKEQAA